MRDTYFTERHTYRSTDLHHKKSHSSIQKLNYAQFESDKRPAQGLNEENTIENWIKRGCGTKCLRGNHIWWALRSRTCRGPCRWCNHRPPVGPWSRTPLLTRRRCSVLPRVSKNREKEKRSTTLVKAETKTGGRIIIQRLDCVVLLFFQETLLLHLGPYILHYLI